MENYQPLEAIGEGSFGKVFRGICKKSQEIVALKFIPKRNKIDSELVSLRREIEIQRELSHPNIVKMIDTFETSTDIVAVCEYVPIQLFAILEKHGMLSEEKVKRVACNLISAIYYLHSLRILHRDIKPQNILITESGVAKLCDFGFSRKMGANTYVLTSIKGTPLYMAPELIAPELLSPYDESIDLWSLGCILFELLTGKPPFCTTSIVQLIKMVSLDHIKRPKNITTECRSFLEGLFQKDPSFRHTLDALIDHPWVKEEIVITDHSIDKLPLTNPLSISQKQIKEEQRQELGQLQQRFSQPKLLDAFVNKTQVSQFENVIGRVPSQQVDSECVAGLSSETGKIDIKDEATKDPGSETSDISFGKNIKEIEKTLENSKKNDEVYCTEKNTLQCLYEFDKLYNQNYHSLPNYSESELYIQNFENNIGSLAVVHNINQRMYQMSLVHEGVSQQSNEGKRIEVEEWSRFLDKALLEFMNGSLDIFMQKYEFSMFLIPLQNITCPFTVNEKIFTLLIMPFVKNVDKNMNNIFVTYSSCAVIYNIIFSFQVMLISWSEYDFPQLGTSTEIIECIKLQLGLLCNLIYSDNIFLAQFCDGLSKLFMPTNYNLIQKFMLSDVKSDLIAQILAIMNQVLRQSSEFLLIDNVFSSEIKSQEILEHLLNHDSSLVISRVCTLIGHSSSRSCTFISYLEEQPNIICDLINMENHSSEDVRRAASFSISCLQTFTELLKETDEGEESESSG